MNVVALRTFRLRVQPAGGAFGTRLLKRFNLELLNKFMFATVATLYKRKAQKVLPVNQSRLKGNAPGKETRWKDAVLKQEKKQLKDRFLLK
jgi:hypothetical protein